MVEVDDVVELTKDRIGIVRYKGPLYGKNGIFYGIELTTGTGKHCGSFRGKRYFMCHKTKGIFVNKKQILYKLKFEDDKKKKKKKSKPSLVRAHTARKSSDLGYRKSTIPRKTSTGPIQDKKSDWKPPPFMQDVLNDNEISDCNAFLNERPSHRGKFQAKTKYPKAPYLPHVKWRQQIYKSQDWTGFMEGINDESAKIEAERLQLAWEEQELQEQEKEKEWDDAYRKEIEKRRIALDEEAERLRQERQELEFQRRKWEKQRKMDQEFENARLATLKLEQEQAMKRQIQLDEEGGIMTKRQSLQELQDIRREIEHGQAKKARHEKKKQRRRRKKEQKRLRKFEKEVQHLKQQLADETAATQQGLDHEIQKLRHLRTKMEHEHAKLRKQRQDEGNAIKHKKQKQLAGLKQLADKERKKLEKAHKTLAKERQKQLWVDSKRKIEQKKMSKKQLTCDNSSDEDRKREDSPSCNRKNKQGKLKQKDKNYKIFFSVNIETDSGEDVLENVDVLRTLLADLFETRSEKDVFEIKTRKKGNGFKIDFGIVIATSMHPADYIDTFDDLTMSGSFQETISKGFELAQQPQVHMWEARYEKLNQEKKKKATNY